MFYLDYEEHLELLTDAEQGQLTMALIHYAKDGIIPEFDGMLKMAFSFIKAQIDRDSDKFKARCEKNRENAEKRWNNQNANACDGNRTDAKHANTDKDKGTDTDTDDDTDTGTDKTNTPKAPKGATNTPKPVKRFVPPAVEDISDYCMGRKNSVDPQRFFDFYQSKGWLVGKSKMKDWQAAVRTWEKSDKPRQEKSTTGNIFADMLREKQNE